MKDKYVLVYLVKGDAGKYCDGLVKDVGERFGEIELTGGQIPAHITLKSPIEKVSLNNLDNFLSEFVKRQKSGNIRMGGFGNFGESFVFVKSVFDKKSILIQKNLISDLNKLGENIHEFDANWVPHSTIVCINKKNNFKNILSYVGNMKKSGFDLKFNNIAILKKVGKYWKVYREYNLK